MATTSNAARRKKTRLNVSLWRQIGINPADRPNGAIYEWSFAGNQMNVVPAYGLYATTYLPPLFGFTTSLPLLFVEENELDV